MATRTVTAMFDRYHDAAEAVGRLEAAGIPHSDISIVSNDAAKRDSYNTGATGATTTTTAHGKDHDATGTGTGTGASLGTMLGGGAGLLAGLGLLAIPGLGPVVAAGWLASTLVGAGAGAATGGVIGALTGAGIDETHAHTYAEGINRGGTLVTVRTDDSHVARVTDILDDEGTVDLDERESSWRQEGWGGRYAGADASAGMTGTTGTMPTAGMGGSAGTAGGTGGYAPGTTGSLAGGPIGAAASTTTGLGTGGNPAPRSPSGRVRTYPL